MNRLESTHLVGLYFQAGLKTLEINIKGVGHKDWSGVRLI